MDYHYALRTPAYEDLRVTLDLRNNSPFPLGGDFCTTIGRRAT